MPGEEELEDRLLVPMDSRAVASPTSKEEYVFYRQGGWSWSIPYVAGMYALETGRAIKVNHEGQVIPFGPILDPAALIQALQISSQ